MRIVNKADVLPSVATMERLKAVSSKLGGLPHLAKALDLNQGTVNRAVLGEPIRKVTLRLIEALLPEIEAKVGAESSGETVAA